jgi:hypothetical protein
MNPAQRRLLQMIYAVLIKGESVWSVTAYIKPDSLNYAAKCDKLLILMADCALWWANALHQIAGLGDLDDLIVTSDHRPGDARTHGEIPCLAFDLRGNSSRRRYFVLEGIRAAGFTRYSDVYADGHIHVDIGDLVKPLDYVPFVVWNPGDKGKSIDKPSGPKMKKA